MEGLLTFRKLMLRITLALLMLAAVMLACSLIGTEKISLSALFSQGAGGEDASTDYRIFVYVRLPRVILACLVGAALASSGVVLQAILRNPLADPYILGISSGAGLGAIIAVISGFTWTFLGRSPIAAFAFAGAGLLHQDQ